LGNWVADYTCTTTGTGIMWEITPGALNNSIRLVSTQIFSGTTFVGTINEEGNVDIPRTQAGGLVFYTGDIEYLGENQLFMTLTEDSGTGCTFAMARQ